MLSATFTGFTAKLILTTVAILGLGACQSENNKEVTQAAATRVTDTAASTSCTSNIPVRFATTSDSTANQAKFKKGEN